PLRFPGRLTLPSGPACDRLRPAFEEACYTPQRLRDEGPDSVPAISAVFPGRKQRSPSLHVALLVATILSVFYVGVQGELYVPLTQVLGARITGEVPAGLNGQLMPTGPELMEALGTGALYTLALLGILGAHEMGHYIMARR